MGKRGQEQDLKEESVLYPSERECVFECSACVKCRPIDVNIHRRAMFLYITGLHYEYNSTVQYNQH